MLEQIRGCRPAPTKAACPSDPTTPSEMSLQPDATTSDAAATPPPERSRSRGCGIPDLSPLRTAEPVEWMVAEAPVPYLEAVAAMEAQVERIIARAVPERVWLVEHPPLYTAGTSARDSDLVAARFPVHRTGRGGQYTYHGPGQRVVYLMLDLQRRRPDVRRFVSALEALAIGALARFNIAGERRDDRVGVWVRRPDKAPGLDGTPAEDKIAAIGIRLRRWVSYHGISINVEPDLDHFAGIVPCGIGDRHFGVTSLVDLGHPVTMPELDAVLRDEFERIFGPTMLPGRAIPAGSAAPAHDAGNQSSSRRT